MVNLDKFVADIVNCVGLPYVSPGYTGTRDVWKLQYDSLGRLVRSPAVSGIDCSGLLVRAFALQGESLYHGSNFIWRYNLTDKGKLTNVKQLQIGMAVFKWSQSGEPAKYVGDGQGNFHHIGVVTGVNPLRITHASSASGVVKHDTVIGKWSHWGKLAKVDYTNSHPQEGNKMKYKVVAQSGDSVNLRKSPSTTSERIAKIPLGTIVEATESGEGWMNVISPMGVGYMLSKFLDKVTEEMTLEQRIKALEDRVARLEGGVG